LRDADARKGEGIKKKIIRREGQLFKGPATGQPSCAQNIEFVDFLLGCDADGPGKGFGGNYLIQ
jgi:hypothetical protein